MLAWELGLKWSLRAKVSPDAAFVTYVPKTWAPVTLFAYFLILAPIAKILFGWMKSLSIYITNPKYTPLAERVCTGPERQNCGTCTMDWHCTWYLCADYPDTRNVWKNASPWYAQRTCETY